MSPSTTRPQDAFKRVRARLPEEVVKPVTKPDFPNVAMFDIATIPPPTRPTRRFPGPRNIRLVRCACGEHRAGLIAGSAKHLVWRTHQVHTTAGGSYPCPSSGRCLCQVPAPDVAGVHTPTCDDHGPWTA